MSKVMEVTTYDKATNTWKPPVPLGALAENVELTNGNDVQSVIGDYSDSAPSVASKLDKILEDSQLGLGTIQEVEETGSDSSTVIAGDTDVDIVSGDTLKTFAEKYNKRGLRTQNAINAIEGLPSWILSNPINHKQFWRGINLIGEGAPFGTIEEFNVAVGWPRNFDNIFIGDYFDITLPATEYTEEQTVRLVVMDIMYDERFPLFLMPEKAIVIPEGMNPANTTEGGYAGSKMVRSILPVIENALKEVVGNVLCDTYVKWPNQVDTSIKSSSYGGWNGASSAAEYDFSISEGVFLPNENMVFGHRVFGSSAYDGYDFPHQLAGFRINPQARSKLLNIADFRRAYWWLSDIANFEHFIAVDWYGTSMPLVPTDTSYTGIAPIIAYQGTRT